jgi:hypothetical protein
MRKVLERCPSCGSDLEITRLNCTSCETVIVGRYLPCPFCKLSPESTRFLETFVRCRGNVKEMERELGISYWTVRRRVDELIEELGLEAEPPAETDVTARQIDILEQVDRGEITAVEASQLLSRLASESQFDQTST